MRSSSARLQSSPSYKGAYSSIRANVVRDGSVLEGYPEPRCDSGEAVCETARRTGPDRNPLPRNLFDVFGGYWALE